MKHRELTEKIIGCAYRVLMAVCLCIVLFAGGGSVRGQGSEVRGQRSGVGGRGAEVGGQRSEVGGQRSEGRSRNSKVRSQEYCEERFEYFNDFIVYFKIPPSALQARALRAVPSSPLYQRGARGDLHHRILVCDVVIELNRGMKLPQERIELRKIIYNTLKELSEPPEMRRGLKEEIQSSLNHFMGDEIIKNIYFTKFVLL